MLTAQCRSTPSAQAGTRWEKLLEEGLNLEREEAPSHRPPSRASKLSRAGETRNEQNSSAAHQRQGWEQVGASVSLPVSEAHSYAHGRSLREEMS